MRGGVVLAGGRSTRFGDQDKAVVTLAGTPLIRRVVDRIAGVVDEVVINCRQSQRDSITAALAESNTELRFAIDQTPDRGPMAGLARGLEITDATHSIAVGCDMPFIDPDFIEYLFDRITEGYADAVVPRLNEWYQPTHAVYTTNPTYAACRRALNDDARQLIAPFEYLDILTISEPTISSHTTHQTFRNINTPKELSVAASELTTSSDTPN
ncbi:molybdenum cofactor guanylyltransferase [Haloquadratum walsbyi]|jgi:Molybdopterin-guanine dinucleotide biosynthesis protein A|uniref:Probable molybdenum cofactor guanylyltransferase n=1 Tax=Haloquadratum walsbyi J07HQW2 TaxID=1238425 RepID=U1PQD4_9EURY|nr:molybdenum cofactor guanylyltransferase [Haloquadratum walsbyi]ERG94536.1 MAG: molybdopterin-guanine dinucleotide biosynthesis protein A [Haloquadratum walsbyi J07HQW2]